MATDGNILVLNPGSSSLKWAVYCRDDSGNEIQIAEGNVERLGKPEAKSYISIEGEPSVEESAASLSSPGEATEAVLNHLAASRLGSDSLSAIGCRVVHGAERFTEPTLVTSEVLEGIRALSPLAPLHNPAAVETLEVCQKLRPNVPAFAVFDTAFHRTLPPVARTYALPHDLVEQHGLYRYGFHGIAHQCVYAELEKRLHAEGRSASRCITCHLGNGASVCAIHDGKSIDTSMGMTPLEGLVMGTRSGDVDPGLLLHLLQQGIVTADELDDLLQHRSGLFGLSGRSADMRDLLAAEGEGDARSHLALEVFAYRVAKTIGAYVVALGGIDGIAFSGGIGEHAAVVRGQICHRLSCLGLALDEGRNAADTATDGQEPARISADDSPISAWVIPADENLQIAREVRQTFHA
jgi:acetate kinase